MKKHETMEILILLPYGLIVAWLLIAFNVMTSGTFGGVFAGAGFLSVGIIFAFIYTMSPAIALIIRWIILWRKKWRWVPDSDEMGSQA